MNKSWCLLAALAALPCVSQAAEIKFRGFASLVGGTTTSTDDELLGYDESLSFRNDSLIALQMDAKLDDRLSATMQLMGRGANGYDPDVEWAYLTYRFSDNLRLSGGRIRIPFYRYSDFIDVGYAYNWIQPPQTVYGFEFPGYDGLSLVHDTRLGQWDSTVQLVFGQFEGNIAELDANIKDLTGFNWTLVRDWLTLRAGYVQSKTDIAIDELDNLSALVMGIGGTIGENLSDVASNLVIDGDPGTFYGLAVGIDYNNIILDAEYVNYEVEDSLLAKTDAYFVAAGYRFGAWVPMFTYSESNSKAPSGVLDGLSETAANTPVPGMGGATLGQVLMGAAAATETKTKWMDLGLRYDFHNSAAFKLSLLQVEEDGADKNRLIRFGIDLIF